jgi:hypothetical protein
MPPRGIEFQAVEVSCNEARSWRGRCAGRSPARWMICEGGVQTGRRGDGETRRRGDAETYQPVLERFWFHPMEGKRVLTRR